MSVSGSGWRCFKGVPQVGHGWDMGVSLMLCVCFTGVFRLPLRVIGLFKFVSRVCQAFLCYRLGGFPGWINCHTRLYLGSAWFTYCHTWLHLGCSAKLSIQQVPTCKMEPQSGIIIVRNRPTTRPTDHPTTSMFEGLYLSFHLSDPNQTLNIDHQCSSVMDSLLK